MSNIIVVQPLPIAAVAISRGTGGDNLRSRDPKEAWVDSTDGSAATLTVDLGKAVPVDTLLLGYARPPAAGATWSITAGLAGPAEVTLQATTALRVPDVAGAFAELSHALWRGATTTARFLAITVTQPAGAGPLSVGVVIVGKAFMTELGREWGDGRQTLDTGAATSLPSGGFAVVEGVRKRLYSWTFGDLSGDETDQLELLAHALGETAPGLVIEDPDRTTGLRARIHYGLFKKWNTFERRNRRQTRWEIAIEQWV